MQPPFEILKSREAKQKVDKDRPAVLSTKLAEDDVTVGGA
jgi:hypothetical protein